MIIHSYKIRIQRPLSLPCDHRRTATRARFASDCVAGGPGVGGGSPPTATPSRRARDHTARADYEARAERSPVVRAGTPLIPMLLPYMGTAVAHAADSATVAADFPPETVALFLGVFVASLLVDLVQHRDHKEVTVKNAAIWSAFWVALSLGFCGWLAIHHADDHPEWPSLFLTGYLLEKTLSVDNLMVFIAIFRYFRIESGLQHRILYYGILGAILFRALFVGIGAGALNAVGPYAEVLFGAFVLWAAWQMLRGGDEDGDEEPHYEQMPLVRWATRFFPVYPKLVGSRFFVTRAEVEAAHDPSVPLTPGVQRWMTPALVCLLVVEGSDVMFSVDSVPAVIAVTQDPLIVYTAMIFAVLGLRSLYFIVEALTRYLVHLEKAVILVLAFIGIKMFVGAGEHFGHWHAPEWTGSMGQTLEQLARLVSFQVPGWSSLTEGQQATASLVVVLGTLALGVVASLIWPGDDD